MKRALPYVLVVVALAVLSALLASALVDSDEDRLDAIVTGIESEGLGPVIDNGAFATGGLEVSAGSELHRFDEGGREAARQLLDELTGIDRASEVRLRQREVTLQDGGATAVLNVELDGRSWVALRIQMVKDGADWRVERVRVMS